MARQPRILLQQVLPPLNLASAPFLCSLELSVYYSFSTSPQCNMTRVGGVPQSDRPLFSDQSDSE